LLLNERLVICHGNQEQMLHAQIRAGILQTLFASNMLGLQAKRKEKLGTSELQLAWLNQAT
jgi:hypothetical protein